MTDQHSITPTPELVAQWSLARGYADGEVAELVAWLRGAHWDRQRQTLATRAADLLERLSPPQPVPVSGQLRDPRRPQPKSLAGEALKELAWVDKNVNGPHLNKCDAVYTIRRALERLQELEGRGDD